MAQFISSSSSSADTSVVMQTSKDFDPVASLLILALRMKLEELFEPRQHTGRRYFS